MHRSTIVWVFAPVLGVMLIAAAHAERTGKTVSANFTSVNQWQTATSDLDKSDDVRAFTSEALFAQSSSRLNRSLSSEELRTLVRVKRATQTNNLLRIRPDENWAFDLILKHSDAGDAQITQFFNPGKFNTVRVEETGVAVQRTLETTSLSVLVRGVYSEQRRKGLIEFQPENLDHVKQFEANGFLGLKTDSTMYAVMGTYVHQGINLKIDNPYARGRNISAVLVSVGEPVSSGFKEGDKLIASSERIFERRLDSRGMKLLAGTVYDSELFGSTKINKHDIFLSSAACSWMATGRCRSSFSGLDVSLEYVQFSSESSADQSQTNSQRRYAVIGYFQPAIEYYLVLKLSRDRAMYGPSYMDNHRFGIELRGTSRKFNVGSLSGAYWGSLRFEHQRYINIGKTVESGGFLVGVSF